ncbi:MAG: ABC transporter ATP-binding protein/permease [Desulfobacterales bacterium]|nr:MAG: ABC transporter ATP-binding protein/permease [Desulfobacterales bacterium]
MKNQTTPIVKKSLVSWIIAGNYKLKLLLLLTVCVTVLVRIIPLEMQKRIVNQAISLKAFELLLIYCGIYLAAVVVAAALKYLTSYLQTVIGQQALTDMRKELYYHVLRLPLYFFRRTQPGMVVQSFVSELATAGDFVGMAIAIPLTSVLSLIAFTLYLLWLNPLLAVVSFAVYPAALLVLPALQRGANKQNQKRVDMSREFSGKIAETISGIHEIQGNAAYHIENSKFGALADRLQIIRIAWNLYRQGMKVSSNFFTSFSPFIIFILGGYLTIHGQLQLGALVAFLSAQEKLFDPWRELIDIYQAYQEASVSYRRTMEYFDVAPEHIVDPEGRDPYRLGGKIDVDSLSFRTEEGIQLLDGIHFSLEPGQQLALVGFSGSGKSTLAHCIAQLYRYTAGHIRIDDREVAELTKKDIASNLGIIFQTPFIFDGSIEENLLYGCTSKLEGTGMNSSQLLPNIDEKIEVLQQTGIFPDVLRFGLNSVLNLNGDSHLIPGLIRIRRKLARRLSGRLAEHVEFFDKEKYLTYSTVAKNLTFGSSIQESFRENNLAANAYFVRFLNSADLAEPLTKLGSELCLQTMDILQKLPLSEPFFFEDSPISRNEMEEFAKIAGHLKKSGRQMLSNEGNQKLLDLALRFIPGRHKMVALPAALEKQILGARTEFRKKITVDIPDAFSFYRKTDYIPSQTILNNVFFGRLKTSNPKVQDTINEQIVQLLIEEDLLETILHIGMQFQVGTKGDRLSGGQRQKLAIARAFLKKPNILIMDEATSALDNRSQALIQKVLDTHWRGETTLIAVVHRLDIIKGFDKIGVMKAGKLEEMGSYDELMGKKGLLYELVSGRK